VDLLAPVAWLQNGFAAGARAAATIAVTAVQPNLPIKYDYLSPSGAKKIEAAVALTEDAARRNPPARGPGRAHDDDQRQEGHPVSLLRRPLLRHGAPR